jgi:tRNA(adenine34) deaminase
LKFRCLKKLLNFTHLDMIEEKTHEFFMKKALQLAQQAYDEDEVPIGALVVCNNQIIGKGYNQVERLKDATAHAEMLAITAASEFLNSKYLEDCTIYITIEPCIMCAGAIKWSQIGTIVYGAAEPKMGFQSKEVDVFPEKTKIISGILEEECAGLIREFFRAKR